jgi:DNA polymerase
MPIARRARPDPAELPGAERFLPPPGERELPALRAAVAGCRGCPLYRDATQAVFGAGEPGARLMIVGEVPGDAEDRAGAPFVGPAGRLLDEGLAQAGIPRADTYVTNAVKHFKFTVRGKRRIHDKPTRYEIAACRPWLDAELGLVQPKLLLLLGATAAQALLGPAFRVTQSRGVALETPHARWTFATVHPSSVLRAPDPEAREASRATFFADLKVVGDYYRTS